MIGNPLVSLMMVRPSASGVMVRLGAFVSVAVGMSVGVAAGVLVEVALG